MARTSKNGGDSKKTAAPKAPARRRSDKAQQATTAANDGASTAPLTATIAAMAAAELGEPSHAEVRRLAYELYMQRGCFDGHDKDDWYEAERQLRQRQAAL